MNKTIAMLIAFLMSVSVLTACSVTVSTEQNDAQQQKAGEQIEKDWDGMAEDGEFGHSEYLKDFTGEMELAGSWQDDVSKRATMEITKKKDGSYDVQVSWGSSAFETSIWEIHGTYDPDSGMLAYEDGKYSVHRYDEKGKETVSDQKNTKGSFSKNGDKLRWHDSNISEDGMFIRISD